MRPQPYINNYRELWKAGSRRGAPPKERSYPSVAQCQTVSSENAQTDSVVWTKQVVAKTICVYTNTCIHSITVKKEVVNLKASGERCVRGLGGRREWRKCN